MAVSSTSSAQSASSIISQQLRVQQAERNADQAEASARSLRQAAAAAQRNADRAQEGARTLQVQSAQADSAVGAARQQVASVASAIQLQGGFDAIREQIAASLQTLDQPVVSAAVVNAEGQTTGTLVNVTA
ncbi:MAG: hypothetical protein QG638_1739 [Pseudomonadota bacterium]|nr:hypothetical protein [Pseudomonadota bacterium]MDQ5919072.1 hypothetical protein [Pseudomonadota bacterium]MDQ5946552.1 hypothetical protein [Pseudomonadota bacterium]